MKMHFKITLLQTIENILFPLVLVLSFDTVSIENLLKQSVESICQGEYKYDVVVTLLTGNFGRHGLIPCTISL